MEERVHECSACSGVVTALFLIFNLNITLNVNVLFDALNEVECYMADKGKLDICFSGITESIWMTDAST